VIDPARPIVVVNVIVPSIRTTATKSFHMKAQFPITLAQLKKELNTCAEQVFSQLEEAKNREGGQ
jgi:hypothetical protein